MTLVSVIIPFYNNIEWLKEAVESVLNQTYSNIEIIVINDGSVEDDTEFLKSYSNLISYVKKTNGGAASARNAGIKISRGEFIAFLDSDDIFSPEKIEKQLEYMLKNDAIWSQHSYQMFNEKGSFKLVDTSMHVGYVFNQIFVSFRVQTSNVMVKRDYIIDNEIEFPNSFKNGQDGEFYKLIAANAYLHYIPDVIGYFRIRGSNVGFNPAVLLKNKHQVLTEMIRPKIYQKNVPSLIVLAYFLTSKSFKFYQLISVKSEKFSGFNKFLSFLCYLPSFMLFKLLKTKYL